jgi:hypothetical protein
VNPVSAVTAVDQWPYERGGTAIVLTRPEQIQNCAVMFHDQGKKSGDQDFLIGITNEGVRDGFLNKGVHFFSYVNFFQQICA